MAIHISIPCHRNLQIEDYESLYHPESLRIDHPGSIDMIIPELHPTFRMDANIIKKNVEEMDGKQHRDVFLDGENTSASYYHTFEGKPSNSNFQIENLENLRTSPNSPTQQPFKWKIGTVQR